MTNYTPPALPTYVMNSDEENYNDELNQTLREWIGETGTGTINLNTAQITQLSNDMTIALGKIFFNTDTAKLQVKTAAGTIETITSA